jgi:transcriptional regulator with XRE-family HTH domain
MSIGKRLAEVRATQGLNQIDFAELLGVPQFVQNYERGAFDPPTSLVVQICERYGVDANWLLFGTRRPNEDELNRMAAAIEWAFNFFEERDLAVTSANLTRAVAVILSILDDKASDPAKALPLLKQLFPETA